MASNLLKIVVLGDSHVGKTALLKQYLYSKFTPSYKSTYCADFETKELKVKDQNVLLQIWDTAGQERYRSLGINFFTGADCCVLMFDVTYPNSFKNLDYWREHFISKMNPVGIENLTFVVIGNKVDLGKRQVSTGEVQAWCRLRNNIPNFETSAKEHANLEKVFLEITQYTLMRVQGTFQLDSTTLLQKGGLSHDPTVKKKEKLDVKSSTLYKVLLLGENGVGKTSIMKQYVEQMFTPEYQATNTTSFVNKEVMVNGKLVTLQIWDSVGSTRFQGLDTSVCKEMDCCLLVFDVTSVESFKLLNCWRDDFLKLVNLDNPDNFPFVVLGNKVDQTPAQVQKDDISNLCTTAANIPYFETSAKDGFNLEEAFQKIARDLLANDQDAIAQNSTPKHDV